jgi:hypothetical protein
MFQTLQFEHNYYTYHIIPIWNLKVKTKHQHISGTSPLKQIHISAAGLETKQETS